MQPWLDFEILLLLSAANGAPVLGKKLFGTFLAHPIDGGVIFIDGHRLLGGSKTIRGVVLSAIIASACALALGISWSTGLLVAIGAMIGDLLSSFVKRRLGRPPSTRALGLDQIPESLLPALTLMHPMSLSLADVAAIVIAFFVGEIVLSRLLFRLRIRDEPY